MFKKISSILIAILVLGSLAGCGKEDEAYSSPSFKDGSSEEATEMDADEDIASISDALMIASYTDATVTDASELDAIVSAIPASLTDALPMGVYDNNVYYNGLAEFKISVDGDKWRFFNAEEVANATGTTKDYINNLWYGYKSPYDEETTYAAIATHVESGSTIIVSYVNPEKYNMPDYSAKEYLEMASGKYEDLKVRHVTFLGKKYEVLDIPAEQTNVGRRTQFAIKEEGIIIVITFTMDEDVLLEDAVGLLTPLYY